MNPQALAYDPLYEPISGQSSVSQYKPTYNIGGSTTHSDDIFGPCSKCLELIVGEGTGCMARNQLFHIKCFTCHKCDCQLQGQPFYPLDGKVRVNFVYLCNFHIAISAFFNFSHTARLIISTHWKNAVNVWNPFWTEF